MDQKKILYVVVFKLFSNAQKRPTYEDDSPFYSRLSTSFEQSPALQLKEWFTVGPVGMN